MKKFITVDKTKGYITAENQTNTDERNLVAGSRNVLIDQESKVTTRNGYSRLGAANTNLTPVRQAVTWNTSTGTELPIRVYDDELEVYLGTVDGTELNAWYRIADGWSTTLLPRFYPWWSDTEVLDYLMFVFGDDNLYHWAGCVAVVDSVTANTITKKGTSTWAENRALVSGTQTLVNTRTGTEYTYTGGEDTTTLTGTSSTSDIVAGDVLVQKVNTTADKPEADRNNHTIFVFQNQICLGSDEDEEVFISHNDSITNFAFSTPRVPGEGALLTLDDPARGFTELNEKLIVFAGKSSIYEAEPVSLTVGSTETETIKVRKYQTGANQSAYNQEVIQNVGDTIIYLSNEPAIRELPSLQAIQGGAQVRTLSNKIKPDIKAETWTNACSIWHDNAYHLSAPANNHLYILQYVEDADGNLKRFWQPPQTMPVRPMHLIDAKLYGGSNSVGETYYLFDPDTYSDITSDDEKIPIYCVAKFAYRNFGDRFNLKTFDELAIEGEISPSTTIDLNINYDFGGRTAQVFKQIEGDDVDILLETLEATALAQQPLGQEPLGGSIDAPTNTAKFRVIFELSKEDFVEMQEIYSTNDVDKYWSIIARGANAQLSNRQNITIKK